MKNPIVVAVLTLALASGAVIAQGRFAAPATPGRMTTAAPFSSTTTPGRFAVGNLPVTPESQAALTEALTGLDGEYAAFAAYDAVIQKFGRIEPYVSIRAAEAQHIAALSRQLQLRGLAVPTNPFLGKVKAPASLLESARQEVKAEDANVALYDRLLKTVNGDAYATRVFTNLRRASLGLHLEAFKAAAANAGRLTAAQMTSLRVQNQASRQMGHRGMNPGGRGMNAQGMGFGPGMHAQGVGFGPGAGYGPNAQNAQPGNGFAGGPGWGRRF